MKSSQLVAIIRRLEAMIEAQDSEVQVRRFEKEGVEKCIVTYDSSTETFELTEANQINHTNLITSISWRWKFMI